MIAFRIEKGLSRPLGRLNRQYNTPFRYGMPDEEEGVRSGPLSDEWVEGGRP
jgi:hypothetical protein